MSSFVSMLWMLNVGIVLILVGGIALTIWMIVDYFSAKGHYNPSDDLIGQIGTVKKDCSPHQRGKVYVAGAYWDAVCEYGAVKTGEEIRVTEFNERFLVVKKVDLVGEQDKKMNP